MQLEDSNNEGTVFTDCTVTGNKGGGVVLNRGSSVKLVGCTLDGVLPEAYPQHDMVVSLSG